MPSHIVWLELLMQIQTRHHHFSVLTLANVDQCAPSKCNAISNGLASCFIVKHLRVSTLKILRVVVRMFVFARRFDVYSLD